MRVRFSYLVLLILAAMPAFAVSVTYTNPAAFLSALPGAASTLTFDSIAVGTPIPSGTTLGGITFTYSIGGLSMTVSNLYNTTSGSDYLGLNDPPNYDQFVAGDEFEMTFDTRVHAVGLYLITGADPLFAGDASLITAEGIALNAATPNLILPDTGTAYFLGIISDVPFTWAHLGFDPGSAGAFLYNVDDITVAAAPPFDPAVPEPAMVWLTGTAVLACVAIARRRRIV